MAYGPKFCYDEFMVTAGPVSAVVVAVTLVIGFGMLLLRPVSISLLFVHIYTDSFSFVIWL